MDWTSPAVVGLIMGLTFAGPALALGVAFRLFNFPDLTLEGSFPTGAAVLAACLVAGVPLPLAIGASFLAGAALGATTAVIHRRLGVNRFLAGILVVAMSYTIDLRLMAGPNIGLIGRPTPFDAIPVSSPEMRILLVLFAIVITVSLGLAGLLRTSWGLRIRLAGSNPEQARALGIEPTWPLLMGLALTNGLVAFSSALLVMQQGFADVSMGQGGLVLALASVTLGEALVPEKRLTIVPYVVASAILGSILYQVLAAYALRLGLAATDLKLVTAAFVLVVIATRARRPDDTTLEAHG